MRRTTVQLVGSDGFNRQFFNLHGLPRASVRVTWVRRVPIKQIRWPRARMTDDFADFFPTGDATSAQMHNLAVFRDY